MYDDSRNDPLNDPLAWRTRQETERGFDLNPDNVFRDTDAGGVSGGAASSDSADTGRAQPRYIYRRPHMDSGQFYSEPRISDARPLAPRYNPGLGGIFYYPPDGVAAVNPKPEQENKEQKRHSGAFITIAVCLAFVSMMLGAAAGVIGARWELRYGGSGTAQTTTIIHADSGGSVLDSLNYDDPQLQSLIQELLLRREESGSTGAMPGELIFAAAHDQVVAIRIDIEYNYGTYSGTGVDTYSGTGFVLTSDGYILTNYHVVSEGIYNNSDIIVTFFNDESYTAKCIGYDEDNDLAVLKVEVNGLSAVTIGASAGTRVGERVYAVGNPRQLNFTMTEGIVSAVNRSVDIEDQGIINMFQIDAAVNPGNSGGPVYNSRGEVIGIVSAKYMDSGIEGLGFAIPIDDVIELVDEIMAYGYVKGKPMLGVTGTTVDAADAQYYDMVQGYYVHTVEEGSAADKAGIKVHDTIVELGGYEVTSSESLIAAKRNFKAGETTTVVVFRRYSDTGEYLTLNITFDENNG